MAYGYVDQLYPVALIACDLHAILLAVHAPRLGQFYRLVREMRRWPAQGPRDPKPPAVYGASKFGRDRNARAERRAGRPALLSGGRRNRGVEFGKCSTRGTTVGEIGVFSPSHQRTATIVCRTDCNMLD